MTGWFVDRALDWVMVLAISVVVAVLVALGVSACSGIHRGTGVGDLSGRIEYALDKRTGLCFAVVHSAVGNGWVVTSIASVKHEACEK
jgi:hypothetical protein